MRLDWLLVLGVLGFMANQKKETPEPINVIGPEPVIKPTPIVPVELGLGETYYNPANDVKLPMGSPNPTWILPSNMEYNRYYRVAFPAGNPWDGWVYKKVSDNSSVAVENFNEDRYGCCL